MGSRVKVPVNTRPAPASPERADVNEAPVVDAASPVTDKQVESPAGPAPTEAGKEQKSAQEWRDRALRLQAEMENFRRRQRWLAEEQILADRERLLRGILSIADDLERALDASPADAESLYQGVALTHQSLMRLLRQEGVEPIRAKGQPFDPAWHEAVGTVLPEQVGAEPDAVVKVMQEGYRMGERLLRPSRVIVASSH